MSAAIALFSKAPVAGRVKTRLEPSLTPEDCAALHRAFVADAWRKLSDIPGISAYLYSDIRWQPYVELAGPARTGQQHGDDLGTRMFHCFEDLATRGYTRMLIVGSDSPTLPAEYLSQGLNLLEEADAVLGPAEDGGYYAVGCRRPDPRMFEGVSWSSDLTLEQTEAAFHRIGFSLRRMPTWFDVDTVEDLRRLAREPALPQNTREWLRSRPSLARELDGPSGP